MQISSAMRLAMIAAAVFAALSGWNAPEPYGGDAGLGDAMVKIFCYGACAILLLIAAIWAVVDYYL